MDESSDNLQFSWGKKKAKGGAKLDIQFYESFTFDNVTYSLYDCVYLFKHGDPEPYIGKIVKIWEQPNHIKRVKILWFFLPNEIQNYLRGLAMEKEIFLASGEGIGLADINPLEAIAGKCSVVCISKDERNRQPSVKEQAVADYIFYRLFDVGNFTLSEQLPEKIAGLEVKFLLNPKDEQTSSVLKLEVDGIDQKEGEGPVAAVPCSLPESAPLRILDNIDKPEQDNGDGERKHLKEIDYCPDGEASLKSRTDLVKEATDTADGNIKYIKNKSQSTLSGEKPSKKTKLFHEARGSARDLQHRAGEKKSVVESDQDPKDSERPIQLHSEKMKNIEGNIRNLDGSVQKAVPALPEKTVRLEPVEVTTRPVDRRKWFKSLPWNERLQKADEQGTLVYIQNLDIHFAPSDVEEIIHNALRLHCTAKLINHPTYDDPNNGKVYLIFKNKEAADNAVSRINGGLVVCGRPVYCSKGLLKVPKPSMALAGHLSIDKLKKFQKQREEQRKAVSTSHCSQPNTIEYDMALDWIFTREKQEKKFRVLHKRHAEELKKFESFWSQSGKKGKQAELFWH